MLVEDFNATVGREDILRPSVANESQPEISNDIGVKGVKFYTSKKPNRQEYLQFSRIVAFVNAILTHENGNTRCLISTSW